MQIRITRRAAAQIEASAAWWAKNRPLAPRAVAEELERSFALLAVQPTVGHRALNRSLTGVRRLHLSRVHHHLYYRVSANTGDILAFWHESSASARSPAKRLTQRAFEARHSTQGHQVKHNDPPDGLPKYRVLTGPDDAAFCRRVSEALALGYTLHGNPAATFNGTNVILAQAIIWPSAETAISTCDEHAT